MNEIDECVDVDDAVDGGTADHLGTVCVADSPKVFTFPLTFDIPDGCATHTNVASFTTNDTGDTGSDSETVEVCGVFFGKTMGFWGNTNGQYLLSQNNAFAYAHAVTLGIKDTSATPKPWCYVKVDTADKSKKILPNTLNGMSILTNCTATNQLDSGINANSMNTLLAQTLAISYNIKYVANYAGQSISELGCTPVNGLSGVNTVEDARDKANYLIAHAKKNSTTGDDVTVTQTQIGLMNTLLGCLNREA
jgi:hypothetical protein